MAGRNSTLMAAKYVPGGARPTAAPQGAGAPYYGMLSPLANQLANERGYCLGPDTQVLCSDFQWRPVISLAEGDQIIGFDEFPEPHSKRKFRMSTVLSCPIVELPSYRITFTDGRQVTASAEHMWLDGRCSRWLKTKNLRPGYRIMHLGTPWKQDRSWGGGWLAGAFDGEANFATHSENSHCGWHIQFSQNAGSVLDLAERLLKERGYETRVKAPQDGRAVHRLLITGVEDCFRFLGSCQPVRLLDNSAAWIEGQSGKKSRGTARGRVYNAVVESVEYLGEQDVVAISTSTRTLFAEGLYSHNSNSYGPFLPRPARTFTEGAFGPFSPILPVPLDAPAVEDGQPDPRLWEYPVGWNLPVGQPGTEGLKLVDFATLKTLSDTYSVARSCIDRRKYEVCGLDWDIVPTHEASKAYQGDRKAMRDFGERVAKAKRFFRHPDPDYFTFSDFLSAMLEEVFVYDALAIVMRPKWGKGVGAGLLGSDLDCLELISGPTIRPLVGLHGEVPRPPAPAYQQYLYGVPRSDYMTMITQRDIDEAGIGGSELQNFRTDQLMYLRTTPRRETPYGFSLTEKAIIPILTGLQKQAFQYDYFREGTVPAVYISPGDASITPNQIRELQDALNAIAGDVAFHHKIIVLPPGSKTMPQRDAQLADQFDEIVMTEVAMVYDVDPMSLGIVPKVATSVSPFAAKEMAQASASVHQRTSTKPLLSFITDIFNNILHRVCGQDDMKFTFEGMSETSDAAATTDLVVKQVQYGIRSVDEGRAELELPPWNMPETSGPVVFTQMGPVPFEMAPQLLMQQQQGAGGSGGGAKAGGGNSSGSGKRTRATSTTGRGDQYGGPGVPRHGNLPAPSSTRISSDVPPERKKTPAHDAAEGAMSTGSSKPGGGRVGASKAAAAELEALGRHLRKGRDIRTWKAVNVPGAIVEAIAEDLQKGLSFDEAVGSIPVFGVEWVTGDTLPKARGVTEWPGWKHDLGLVAAYTDLLRRMFSKADGQAGKIRGEYAHSVVSYTPGMFDGMIADHLQEKVAGALEPLAREAWKLGYGSALELIGDRSVSFGSNPDAFVGTEVRHWAETIARTGLKDAARRAEVIARTEVARGVSAGAMQAYADAGISYKHLLLAPDDACEKCVDADEEVIPLHAPFGTGDVAPPFHPQCRCGVAPSGVDVTPPQGHLGKSESERKPDVAFLLIRTRNSEGKRRYLLQKRGEEASHPGTWGLFGGKGHPGETPWETACREAGEETGGLPKDLVPRGVMFTPGDKRDCWTYVCDVAEEFSPGGGVTPWESASWGWFSRDDVSGLELHPKFAETWDVYVGEVLGKSKKRVLVSGQEIYPSDSETGEDDEWPASGGGGEYPHSHDVDGTPVAPGGKPGSEPPRWDGDEAEPYVQMPGGPGGAAGRAPDSPAGGGSCDSTCDDPGHAHSTPIDGNVPDDEDDARQPFVRGRPPNAIGKGRS